MSKPAFWVGLVVALGWGAATPSPVAAGEVSWCRLPRTGSLPAPGAGIRLYCGGHGVVDLAPGDAEVTAEPASCPKWNRATEVPPLYPSYGNPGPFPPPVPTAPVPLPLQRLGPSVVAAPAPGPSASSGPCSGGSCFAPLSQIGPHQPWVAVIDWNDEHGWDVGALLHRSLDAPAVPLALFPLVGDPRLIPYSADGVSDVHVLAKLCEVAEAVYSGQVGRPVALNLSFGRNFRPVLDGDRTACPARTLGCQIDEVFRGLTRTQSGQTGSVIVAAAGNYRKLQFPAALHGVVVAGGLDITAFESSGASRPTWETPWYGGQAMGLFPASGYCIEEPGRLPAALPPGSSFSAALFSGWLTSLIQRGTVIPPVTAGAWGIQPGTLSLLHGSSVVAQAHPGIAGLLKPVLGSSKTACGSIPAADAPAAAVKVAAAGSAHLPLPQTSFLDMMGLLSTPTPNADPCIPCIAILSEPPQAFAPIPGGPWTRAVSSAVLDVAANDLRIDLSVAGSSPFPANLQLVEVYLRIGGRTWPLELDAELLAGLQSGGVKSLQVADVGAAALQSGTQPSLLFVLEEPGGPPFWSAIPILLRSR